MGKKKLLCVVAIIAVAGIVATTFLSRNYSQKNKEVKTFTAFFFATGRELNDDNDIMELIAKKTGAKCIETWSDGTDYDSQINNFIVDDKYPDFISGSTRLLEAEALIPIDEYFDKYPNLRNYLTEQEWDALRQEDGHIYWIPQFGVYKNESTDFIHDGEAFWIQQRVLKWANYPTVTTVDEYFDLLEAYTAANPYMEDGVTENIPFTVLCHDWRFFCLENVPQFLDGYPNDGSCIVNPDTLEVIDYNTTPTAKRYFKKLNEEYKKGIVDKEAFTSTYDEYIAKLSTGAVLGMIDQRWQFIYGIMDAYSVAGLSEQGCEYVPLPITISKDVKNQYHQTRKSEFDSSTGLSISVSCSDVEGALQFVNDLLSDEVMLLRYWGVQGVDYDINEDGMLYIPDEMYERLASKKLALSHFCTYSYFPRFEGVMDDGKNAYIPEYQVEEQKSKLSPQLRECLDAYGVDTFVDLLGTNEKPGPWYPMYSYSDQLTYSSEAGTVFNELKLVKHLWLPSVIMADDFEAAWDQYMEEYEACNPQVFLDAMQEEVYRRVEFAKEN